MAYKKMWVAHIQWDLSLMDDSWIHSFTEGEFWDQVYREVNSVLPGTLTGATGSLFDEIETYFQEIGHSRYLHWDVVPFPTR